MNMRRIVQSSLVAAVVVLLVGLSGGCPGTGLGGDSTDTTGSSSTGGTSTGGTSGSTTPDGSGGPPPPAATAEGAVDLPTTGQTVSYATDDDGDLQLGETMTAAQRFTDNGDGTITDELTGLMWLQDASCLITRYPEWETDGWADGWVPWTDALEFIADINSGTAAACGAGHTDWRLPNVNELESLVNAGEGILNDWLISVGFLRVEAREYWTSTTDPDASAVFAYAVDMTDGNVSRLGNKSSVINSVWPVRDVTDGSNAEVWATGQTTTYYAGDDGAVEAGTSWPDPRFIDNGDGTITDGLTGLMWLQDAESLGSAAWTGALLVANRFNTTPGDFDCENYTATYTDWRVPNRKELFSLNDLSQAGPSLQTGHPFIGVSNTASYWTSTTYAGSTSKAWHGDLRSGEIGSDFKTNAHRVTLVR